METGLLEHRYRLLRNHLDDLGYRQCLVIECLPLVERLVSDLLRTTESLRHYKDLAQKSLEKCSNLELGSEPYKLDNARLVKECNELHLNLLHQQEDAQKAQKELKHKVRKLESENSDLQFLSSQSIAKIKVLEQESAQKTRKILQLQNKGVKTISTLGGKKKLIASKSQPTFELDSPLKPTKSWQEQYWNASAQAKDPYIANMVDISDKRISCLSREVNLLREEKNQQAEIIATFKNQLNNRDREIQRLSSMLEGGRPITAIRRDCCCSCKDMSSQIDCLSNEVKRLEVRKEELEQEVKDSVANQHEAMARAVLLAERNKKLEQELRDIDQMALAVEAECNSTVKENSMRVCKIQEKLENSLMQIHDLEREVLELKRNNQELQASVESIKNEKKHLQRKLESVIDEKKKNLDRLNELTIIERGLNNEIERMAQESAMQSRKIAELESQLGSRRTQSETVPEKTSVQKRTRSGKRTKSKSPSLPAASKSATSPSRRNAASPSRRRAATPPRRSAKSSPRRVTSPRREEEERESVSSPERKSPSETRVHSRDRIHKEPSHKYNPKLNPEQYEKLIDKLQEERDFYYQECLKSKEISATSDNNKEMQWRLNEKEQQLQELKTANQELLKERQILQTRLNSSPNKESHSTMTSPKAMSPPSLDQVSGMSLKTMLKRLEQERDLARGDVHRLEEERDALRERLKIATETQVAEHARLEKTVIESEERVRKLEAERRELLSSQGSKKATISNMENHLESTQTKLVSLQSELSEQRTLYNQIKSLQEQTDRALADSQGQIVQSELELNNARGRVRQLEKERAALDHEVATLKNENSVMRGSLAQVDQEKDGLLISIDTKTERIAMLEQELKTKDDRALKLDENLTEVKKKLSIALDDLAGRDSKARNAEKEVERLRRELEMSERARESALNENRLLHNDLAAITEDLRKSNHDLELARQEVENLKHQLQDYVSEVRRVEDLLSRKEEERGEMLDHYRSLSLEASALEDNNHSLETEVQEARSQIRLANDRLIDLQQQLEARDTLVHGYENQIAELSANVARLETQLHDELNQRRHIEEELGIVRDLCTKLDGQKEGLMNQVKENDLVKMQLETELARLRDEQELLQEQISRDHESIQTLENLLATCRQETLDQKVSNEGTQTEVNSLRRKVAELQDKLTATTTDLQRCQQQAAEYSQNMTELQRTITNERFERAREEETRRFSSSSNQQSELPQPFIPTASRSPSRANYEYEDGLFPVPAVPSPSKPSRHEMTNIDSTNQILDDTLNVNVTVNQTMPSSLPQCTSITTSITTPAQSRYDPIQKQFVSTAPSFPSSSTSAGKGNYHQQTLSPSNININTSNQNPEEVVTQSSVPQSNTVTTNVTSASQSRFRNENQNLSSNFSTPRQMTSPSKTAKVSNSMPLSSFQNKSFSTNVPLVASDPEDENNLAEVGLIERHDPITCKKKNCSGKGCGKKCPKKVCIKEPSFPNIPQKQGVSISSSSQSQLRSPGELQSSQVFPLNQSIASTVESPHIPKPTSFPSSSQLPSFRGMQTSKSNIGKTTEMSMANHAMQLPSSRTEVSPLKSILADQSHTPQTTLITSDGKSLITSNKSGEQTIYSTFTSTGTPVLSYDATYTVVRQNGGKATTNTTLSLQGSNVHSSSSEQIKSNKSEIERISKYNQDNSNRIIKPSVRSNVQLTGNLLSQWKNDYETSGYNSKPQNHRPSAINSSAKLTSLNYQARQPVAHTLKSNSRQELSKNLQYRKTDEAPGTSRSLDLKDSRRDEFGSAIFHSEANRSASQGKYGLNLFSNQQKELPTDKSIPTWSRQYNRDESRFNTSPLRKWETTVITNIRRNQEGGNS